MDLEPRKVCYISLSNDSGIDISILAYWDTPPSSKDLDIYSAYTNALDRYWQRDNTSSASSEQVSSASSRDPIRENTKQQQPYHIRGGTLKSHQLDGLK